MYTEFHFNAALKEDVPSQVLQILQYMLNEREEMPDTPDHELFDTNRWEHMLRCDSYYFEADTHSTLRYDGISKHYYLCIRCNLKNYDQEINKFVDWIHPYLQGYSGDFLGFSRYEESNEPILIYKQ